MNFDDTPEEAAYRAKIRAWIDENKPDLSVLAPDERVGSERHMRIARAWQARKADAGYACIGWPKEWGGAGGTAMEEAIFGQEEGRAGVRFTYFMTGLAMLLPALLQHNTDALSLSLVPPALRGDKIWCQLFSEPSNGSDTAAARTMAVREGDGWVINGQKVWNSGAQIADYGLLMTRSDPAVPKHKGLTVFWVDMKAPGIDVRPIHVMSDDYELNEVFLTDVRIPDAQRVGEVGGGWKVVISTLMNERAAIGSGIGLSWRDIMEIARRSPAFDGSTLQDPAFREALADWYVNAEGVRLLSFQTLTTLSRGGTPGPENAAGKLLYTNQTQELCSQALEIQDLFGLIDDPQIAMMNGAFQHRFMWSPGLRLGGGTDEIMKNIIAERVLGLPGDIRVDKDVPFNKIPSGR
jgi:alkylation response protein AidB-like acyl-CoA dehydrogenase